MSAMPQLPETSPRSASYKRLNAVGDQVSIDMDRRRAPLVRVVLFGTVTDEAFERYLADSDAVVAANTPYVLFYDAVGAATVSAEQRRRQVAWIRSNEAALSRLCFGAAFHFESALMRGALTAILWMARLPFEYVIVANREQGLDWAEAQLRAAHIAFPPRSVAAADNDRYPA